MRDEAKVKQDRMKHFWQIIKLNNIQ